MLKNSGLIRLHINATSEECSSMHVPPALSGLSDYYFVWTAVCAVDRAAIAAACIVDPNIEQELLLFR